MAYRKPRNAKERVAEARAAIARLEETLSNPDNRGGAYGDNCRDAIRRWQEVINAENLK